MTARCTYSGCGSYALNIAPDSGLCDVHLYKAQRDYLLAACQLFVEYEKCCRTGKDFEMMLAYNAANDAIHAAIAKATKGEA